MLRNADSLRVDVVDPSAYTPPYDHALCAALARAGATVRLQTSRFAYAAAPAPAGYERVERFYRRGGGAAGSRRRFAAKVAQHVPDMLRYARAAAGADVVHLQWLTIQPLDVHLLPRSVPLVLTAHDVLPREPRRGQLAAQRRLYERVDAVVVHSEHGRGRLVEALGIDPAKVNVIEHGAFEHLVNVAGARPLPAELAAVRGPVVLCFGLLRPYKGIDVLLDAWRRLAPDAELWIVGMPRMDIAALRARAPASVRWVPRFVADHELGAYFERADLVVLPYREIDQSGVLFTALAFGAPLLLSDVGGFGEVAAQGAAALVAPADAAALAAEIDRLLGDGAARATLAQGAHRAAATRYSWDAIARRHLDLYERLARR
ncbi:MAG TPA: glycosyltransferase family 4 protein [Solirubrobacteraceae bacterium]|jgi:glycosyltransferase involved in cell wall biosynthesis|nr:glycosyltransferase family 4 protein [Solirubrobacteraceae bacterium]